MKHTTQVVQTACAKALPCKRFRVQAPARPFVIFSKFSHFLLFAGSAHGPPLAGPWHFYFLNPPLLTDKQTGPEPKHKIVFYIKTVLNTKIVFYTKTPKIYLNYIVYFI